ncbi:hypothetical protein DPSP01_001111 [Paraphaeosphaeria sporulosa]
MRTVLYEAQVLDVGQSAWECLGCIPQNILRETCLASIYSTLGCVIHFTFHLSPIDFTSLFVPSSAVTHNSGSLFITPPKLHSASTSFTPDLNIILSYLVLFLRADLTKFIGMQWLNKRRCQIAVTSA